MAAWDAVELRVAVRVDVEVRVAVAVRVDVRVAVEVRVAVDVRAANARPRGRGLSALSVATAASSTSVNDWTPTAVQGGDGLIHWPKVEVCEGGLIVSDARDAKSAADRLEGREVCENPAATQSKPHKIKTTVFIGTTTTRYGPDELNHQH